MPRRTAIQTITRSTSLFAAAMTTFMPQSPASFRRRRSTIVVFGSNNRKSVPILLLLMLTMAIVMMVDLRVLIAPGNTTTTLVVTTKDNTTRTTTKSLRLIPNKLQQQSSHTLSFQSQAWGVLLEEEKEQEQARLLLLHTESSMSSLHKQLQQQQQQQQQEADKQKHGETDTATTDYSVKEYWFDTQIDHFNFRRPIPSSATKADAENGGDNNHDDDDDDVTTTFPLRYFVNDKYYNKNNNTTASPVLFYAGNEADITQFVNNSGFLFEAAQTLDAMVVFAEHRYYGQSFPFGGTPQTALGSAQNISFLTVEQAMADFNTLQVHIRQVWNMTCDTAFIVAGGSYGGNLALWLRLKNPNLWAGALASSATPLKHLLRESNSFNRIVADVYGNVSQACPSKIRKGYADLFDLMAQDSNSGGGGGGGSSSSEGRDLIQRELRICHMPSGDISPQQAQDIAVNIHGWISAALETMVQYGYPYPTSFYNPVPAYPFRVACESMLKEETGLKALKAAVQVYYNYTGQAGKCFDWVSNNSRKHFWNRLGQIDRSSSPEKDIGEDADWTGIAWGYQCCTEVYQPMPTNNITDFEMPYTPNQTAYFQSCQERWEGVTPRPDWEEMTFWSNNIQAGSNIFLTSGQLDPWRAAGIQILPQGMLLPDSVIVRIIENGAHHYDLRPSHPLDTQSVVKIRLEEIDHMRQWVKQWRGMYPASNKSSSNRFYHTGHDRNKNSP